MDPITIEQQVDEYRLEQLGVYRWGLWSKEVSVFPWHYDATETCYFLQGEVVVTPAGGAPIRMGKGDLVTFAHGLSCHWEILSAVTKHYNFD